MDFQGVVTNLTPTRPAIVKLPNNAFRKGNVAKLLFQAKSCLNLISNLYCSKDFTGLRFGGTRGGTRSNEMTDMKTANGLS